MRQQWNKVKRRIVNTTRVLKPNRPVPKPRMSKKRQRDMVPQ